MTLLVRDEEDIIEWNLRYHLARGIDHFIVTDNRSVDGTVDILREYERKGVVTLIHESGDDYAQDRWVTRMARHAQAELSPDWLLHCDADEFWWPEGARTLHDAFSAVHRGVRVVSVDRCGYVGPAEGDDRPFFERMVYRTREATNAMGDPLPPKIAHRPLWRPYVHMGNHGVSRWLLEVKPRPLDEVSILHFPARTPDQLRNKIEKGGAATERNPRHRGGVLYTWRAMYRWIEEGREDRVIDANFMNGEAEGRKSVIEDHRLRDYLASL